MRDPKHFHLRTLGALALRARAGEVETAVAVRPRHLAVLVVLALANRPLPRDTLVGFFWGSEPEDRARHSLSNALSTLRAVLGARAIPARRDTVQLAPTLPIAVDVAELVAASEGHDHARVVALYAGPFLDGVAVPDAPSFEAWTARERARVERLFVAAAERLAPDLLRARDWAAAATLAERWLEAAPTSTAAAALLLRARAGPDTPAALRAALGDYARVRTGLAELGTRPDSSLAALAAELDRRLAAADVHLAAVMADDVPASTPVPVRVPAVDPPVPPVAPERALPHPRLRVRRLRVPRLRIPRRWQTTVVAAGLALPAALWVYAHHGVAEPLPARPVIAVTDIENVRGDTAIAWLRDGLGQIIADDLAHTTSVEAVAPARVRETLERRDGSRDGSRPPSLSPDAAVDVARRVGATWSVTGGLTAGGGLYVLDVGVRDTHTRAVVRNFTVLASDPVHLGHLAATRLLDIAREGAGGLGGTTPEFADDPGNTSPGAYEHLVRGLQLWAAGRHPDETRELDAAIALDSGLVAALVARRAVAESHDETPLVARLDAALARHRDRMTPWDRLTDELDRADHAGESDRAEVLAARLAARFPRDPRAYQRAGALLISHGQWAAADSVYQRALALDSLAMEVGSGPCAPCVGYDGLAAARVARGDLAGAVQAARRWAALQPGVPRAWLTLQATLSFAGRLDEAVEAGRRALTLTDDANAREWYARTLLMARQWAAADAVAAELAGSGTPAARATATDLRVTLLRERGRYREALATLRHAGPRLAGLELVEADLLARLGRVGEARRVWERAGHARTGAQPAAYDAAQARAFAWAHALEGDALAHAGDTAALRVLADSVAQLGARSYYGRDWRLYHHLRGLLAAARGDLATAERELRAARWGVSGWTRTDVELARVWLAAGRPQDAVGVLRDAYAGPLDAMGRYVPRTELDWWMARAFAAAGRDDSARAYAARVRAAWADADPEVRALLSALPPAPATARAVPATRTAPPLQMNM